MTDPNDIDVPDSVATGLDDQEPAQATFPQDQPAAEPVDQPTERGVVMPLPTRQRGVILGEGQDRPRMVKPPTGRVVTVETVSLHRARDDGPPFSTTSRFVDHTYSGGGGYSYDLDGITPEGVQLAGLPQGGVSTICLANAGALPLLVGTLGGDPLLVVLPAKTARWRPAPGCQTVVAIAPVEPAEPQDGQPPAPTTGRATVTLYPD